MAIPARVSDRLAAGIKRFQPILSSAKSRDVNESDTSMIVADSSRKSSATTSTAKLRASFVSAAHTATSPRVSTASFRYHRSQGDRSGTKGRPRQASRRLCREPRRRVGGVDEWQSLARVSGHLCKADRRRTRARHRPAGAQRKERRSSRECLPAHAREHVEVRPVRVSRSLAGHKQVLPRRGRSEQSRSGDGPSRASTTSDAKIEIEELRQALKLEVMKREVIEGEKADGTRKKVSKSAGKMLRIRKGKDEADEPADAAEATDLKSAGDVSTVADQT